MTKYPGMKTQRFTIVFLSMGAGSARDCGSRVLSPEICYQTASSIRLMM